MCIKSASILIKFQSNFECVILGWDKKNVPSKRICIIGQNISRKVIEYDFIKSLKHDQIAWEHAVAVKSTTFQLQRYDILALVLFDIL